MKNAFSTDSIVAVVLVWWISGKIIRSLQWYSKCAQPCACACIIVHAHAYFMRSVGLCLAYIFYAFCISLQVFVFLKPGVGLCVFGISLSCVFYTSASDCLKRLLLQTAS